MNQLCLWEEVGVTLPPFPRILSLPRILQGCVRFDVGVMRITLSFS